MWSYNYANELYHYGIKGMKWGHRKNSLMTIGKNDLKATKQVKNDYNRLSNKSFKQKYSVNKNTYAKRVSKSLTGDPLADKKAKTSSKNYSKIVKYNAGLKTKQNLNEKAKKYNSTRSKGAKAITSVLTGGTGNKTYSMLRASGYSKIGATAATVFFNPAVAQQDAYDRYAKSKSGKKYNKKVRNTYYNK